MRPTVMRTSTTTVLSVLLLVVLTGCGDEGARTAPTPTAHWRDCTTRGFEDASGATARLSQGGRDVTVKLVPAGEGPCGGGLVTRSGSSVSGVDVHALDLDPDTARVVHLGERDLLLVLGGFHPRGGFQPHLFGLDPDVGEVTVDGRPLLAFVATDGGGTPTGARCGRDGTIDVLTATTSKPPGIVLAWDVTRTTYRLDGNQAVETGSEQIRDHVADPTLRKAMPDLFDPEALFARCQGS